MKDYAIEVLKREINSLKWNIDLAKSFNSANKSMGITASTKIIEEYKFKISALRKALKILTR